ncbi:hypothetical protein M0Q50_05950 [bacterium]|jgi:hypothetical protein|nr:hypothetical protein [bacterium]
MKNLVHTNLDDFLNEKENSKLKTKKEKMAKFKKTMGEWKEGELNIGKSNKKVPKTEKGRKQAIAISMSQTK